MAMKKKGVSILVSLIILSLLIGFSAYGQDKGDDVYVIKKGDTLWDLSEKYLDDPYQWPDLWQRNQYITNPHLIYPGNALRLEGGPGYARPEAMREIEEGEGAVTEAEPIPETAEAREIQEVIEEAAVTEGKEEKLERTAHAEDLEIAQVLRKGHVQYLILEEASLGTIVDARYEKRLLAQGDTVYLAMKEQPPEVGQRFLIFRAKKTLKNPYNKKKWRKIYILGALKVTAIKGVFYQAEITDSMDSIWRGDEVMKYRVLE